MSLALNKLYKTKVERFVNLEAMQEQFDEMNTGLGYGERNTITALYVESTRTSEQIYCAWTEERLV